MIYLPLYVAFEYPDIGQRRQVAFYNMPNSTWHLSESRNTDSIYEHTCRLDLQMGSPTTYEKTNEIIKKALRNNIYPNQMPERIKSGRCAMFFVSLIDGKKTQRLLLDIETKSKMQVTGTSYRDVVNSDSFTMSHLEIPKYYPYNGELTACIYNWFVEYRVENTSDFWNCGYTCLCRNRFPKKRLVRGGYKNTAEYGGSTYYCGNPKNHMIPTKIMVAFEYIAEDRRLKRVQIEARPSSMFEIGTELNANLGKYIEQTVGIRTPYFYNWGCVHFKYSIIPEPLRSEPDEIKAKRLVKFVVDRYFSTRST